MNNKRKMKKKKKGLVEWLKVWALSSNLSTTEREREVFQIPEESTKRSSGVRW
jgi:hypothetical protein